MGGKIFIWTYEQVQQDGLLAIAADVAFYALFALFALFPVAMALVSSYGLFADLATISSNLQSVASMLPPGSYDIIRDQIARVLSKESSTLSSTFIFGFAVAL